MYRSRIWRFGNLTYLNSNYQLRVFVLWKFGTPIPCQNLDRQNREHQNYRTTRTLILTLTLTLSLTLFLKPKPISLFRGFVVPGFVDTPDPNIGK